MAIDIESMMENFNKDIAKDVHFKKLDDCFKRIIIDMPSGEGMIGANSYLILWDKSEIEELNDAYGTEEFLQGIILIGSDGGDNAYGIDDNGFFYEIPFIGMSNKEAVKLGDDFNDFINSLWNR